jgi:HTH-type transcriptional regulator / antitoxin HipB
VRCQLFRGFDWGLPVSWMVASEDETSAQAPATGRVSPLADICRLSPFADSGRMSSIGDTMKIITPKDLGLTIRARRKQLALDQLTLAARVGVSRQWIVEIEKGKPRAEIGLVLRTLRELGIQLEAGTPDAVSGARKRGAAVPDIDAIVERSRGER